MPLSRFLPSDSREQRSDVGLHGIAAHSVLVSPARRRLVSVAVTKHFCLTAVNRCGALCCPDFPHLSARQTGLLGAVYGNRTRLLGLGSRCTTDVLTPQFLNRPQNYCFFLNLSHFCGNFFLLCLFQDSRCRRITASLSALYVRTGYPVSSLVFVSRCSRLQTPRARPIQDKCGCSAMRSVAGCLPAVVFLFLLLGGFVHFADY